MPDDWRQIKLTGIMLNPGRQQPWTVWHRGFVLRFCEEQAEAAAVLVRAERWLPPGVK